MRSWVGKFRFLAGLMVLLLCGFWSFATGSAAAQSQEAAYLSHLKNVQKAQQLLTRFQLIVEQGNLLEMRRLAFDISQNYEARLLLKKEQYQSLGETYHKLWLNPEDGLIQRVISRTREKLKNAGYPDFVQDLTLVRNKPKPGQKPSAPMDFDVGVLTEGREESKVLLDHLRNIKSASGKTGIAGFHETLQQALEESYQEVALFDLGIDIVDPKKAFITGTTAFHPEAYADAAVLGKETPGRDWVQQTADVSKTKVDEMNKLSSPDPKTGKGPKISKGAAYVEAARGTLKDLDKVERVFAQLEKETGTKLKWTATEQQVIKELQKLTEGIDEAGNIIDPYAVNESINKDIFETCKNLVGKMEAAWKLMPVTTPRELLRRVFKRYLTDTDYEKALRALEEGKLQDLPASAKELQRQLQVAAKSKALNLQGLEPQELLARLKKMYPQTFRFQANDEVVLEIIRKTNSFNEESLTFLFGPEGGAAIARVREKMTPLVRQKVAGRYARGKFALWQVDEKNMLLLGDQGSTLKADAGIALAMTFYQMSEVLDQGLSEEQEMQNICRIWLENLPVLGDFYQMTIEGSTFLGSGEAEQGIKALLWLSIGAANLVPQLQVPAVIAGLGMASWELGRSAWDVGKDKQLINAWVESGNWEAQKGLLKGIRDNRKQSLALSKLTREGVAGYAAGLPGVTIRESIINFIDRNDREFQEKAKIFKKSIKNLYPDFDLEQALREKPPYGRTLLAAKIGEAKGNPRRDPAMAMFVKLLDEYEKAAPKAVEILQAAAEKEYQARHFVGEARDIDKQLEALGKRLNLPLLQNVSDIFKSFTTMMKEVASTPWVRDSVAVRLLELKKKYLAGYLAIEGDLTKITGEMTQLGLQPPSRWNLSGFLEIDAPRAQSLLEAYRVNAIGQARKEVQVLHAAVAQLASYQFNPQNACDLELFRTLAQIRIRAVHTRDWLLLHDQWAGKTSAAAKSRDEALRRAQEAARDQSLYLQAKDGIWDSYESAYAWSKKTWEGSEILGEARQQIQERLKKLQAEYNDAKVKGRAQLAACLQQDLQAALALSEPQPAAGRPFTATLVIKQGKIPAGVLIRWRTRGGVKVVEAKGLAATLVAQADGQGLAALIQTGKVLKEFSAAISLKKDGLTGVIELAPKQPAVNQKITATLVIKEGQAPKDAQIQWRADGGVKLEQARGLTATLMVQGNGQVIAALVQKGKTIQEFSVPVTVTPEGLEAGIELSNPNPSVNQQISASLVFRKGQLPKDAGIKWRTTGGLVLQKDSGQSATLVARGDGQVMAALIKDGKTLKEFAAAVVVRQQEKPTATPTGYMDKGVYKFKLTAPEAVRYSEIFKIKAALPPEIAARAAEYVWEVGASLEKGVAGPSRGDILDRKDAQYGGTSLSEVQAQFNAWSLLNDNPKMGRLVVNVNGKDGMRVANGETMVQLIPESLAIAYPDTWNLGKYNKPDLVELSKTTTKFQDPSKKDAYSHYNTYSQTHTSFKVRVGYATEDVESNKTIASLGRPFSLGDFHGFLKEDPPSGQNRQAGVKGYAIKGKVRIYAEGSISHNIHYSISEPEQQHDRGLGQDHLQKHWQEMQAVVKSIKLGPGGSLTSYPGDKDPASSLKDPADKPKQLKVSLTVDKRLILTGEKAAVRAVVENADPKDQPLTYTWTGEHEGQGANVGFAAAKPGKYTLKVEVKSPKGVVGTASLDLEVVEGKVEIVKVSPTGNSIPVGGKATFQVKFSRVPGKSYIYRWQPQPEAAWDNPEGPATQAAATFKRPGPVKVWVTVLEKKGTSLTTVAESAQLSLEVVRPQLKLTFSPTTPLISEEVRARVEVTPVPPDLSLRWQPLPNNAQLLKESQDGREITFALKDDKPVPVKVLALVKGPGDSLGEASGTIQARKFKVTATVVGPMGPEPMKWDPAKGGLVPDPKAIAIHQNVRVKAAIAPDPSKGPVRWRWSVNPDSHIQLGEPGSTEIMVNRSQVGTCELTVVAEDSQGSKLGEAKTSFQVTVDQGSLSKTLREEAQKKAAAGHLDEAIALMEQAVKLDPVSTANANFLKKLKTDKETIGKQLEKTNALISQGKFVEAEKELVVAKRVNAKYPPVLEAEKRLAAAKVGPNKEAEAKLAQAKTLASQGRLDEAIRLAAEAAKLDPRNAEAPKLVSDWQALQKKAAGLKAEGKNLEGQGKLEGAVAKYQEALKLAVDSQLAQHVAALQARLGKDKQNREQAAKLRQEGEALEGQKKLAEAIAKYQESLRILPDAKLAEHVRALQTQVDQEKQAQKDKEKQAGAEKTKPVQLDKEKDHKELARRLRNEGAALQQQGKLMEAIDKYKESLKYYPDPKLEAETRSLQARLDKEAKEFFYKGFAERLRREGKTLQEKGKLPEAVAKYKESLKYQADPKLQEYTKGLEAQLQKDTGPQKNQEIATRLRREGKTLQDQGKLPEAIAKYRESLKYQPDPGLEAQIRTLQTLLDKGKKDQQVQAAKDKEKQEKDKQAAANKEKATRLRNEAAVLEKQGKLPEAIARYKGSLKYQPDPQWAEYVKGLEAKLAKEKKDKPKSDTAPKPAPAGFDGLYQGTLSGPTLTESVTFSFKVMNGSWKGKITLAKSPHEIQGTVDQKSGTMQGKTDAIITKIFDVPGIKNVFSVRGQIRGGVATGTWESKTTWTKSGRLSEPVKGTWQAKKVK